jgi:NhaA family Na+:H+ antiporter
VATATDIAFALAALAMVAPRMPPTLRVFLMTLAIADDLGAVALIGVLYSGKIHLAALLGAAASLAGLAMLSRWKRAPFLLYALGFALAWGFCLKSGVNTSLAGVCCALTVPIGARRAGGEGVLKTFMDSLHPYVAFGILPLFAFTAAGFSFSGLDVRDLVSPITLGVLAALLIGKPLGVFGFSLLGVSLRLGRRPTGTTWLELLGVAILCGVGFTMSLYLGALAFRLDGPAEAAQVRLGVITGSILAVLAGGAILALARRRRDALGVDLLD